MFIALSLGLVSNTAKSIYLFLLIYDVTVKAGFAVLSEAVSSVNNILTPCKSALFAVSPNGGNWAIKWLFSLW